MNKEFIPYEQALELKELSFDEQCMFPYHRNNTEYIDSAHIELANYNATEKLVSAVLYQQAFRWFREKYDLFGCIDLQVCTPSHWFIRIDKIEINDYLYHSEDKDMRFNTYEEAELECLKKLIEISKNERK
jgi:hypothetical protein